jgi:hypothetical protein
MEPGLFSRFSALLKTISDAELLEEVSRPDRLLLTSDLAGGKRIDVAYAPFDHVNPEAEIAIIGLTPGRQQMRNALVEARRLLMSGASEAEALESAKAFASFSGPMRPNLVRMLDHMDVHRLLRLPSTAALWESGEQRAHFTSVLRYPVFIDGKNYSGTPAPITRAVLREQLTNWFEAELRQLPRALLVPLGPKVADAVFWVADRIGFDRTRVLSGFPHPSGANGERIAFFLGLKQVDALSSQVDAASLTAAQATLAAKLERLFNERGAIVAH